MKDRIKLGISACLLGEMVRYDGGHKMNPFLADTLEKYVAWVPVCPEVECGLPVPRESMHLVGEAENPRLRTICSGKDHTNRMLLWANARLKRLEKEELSGFIFKGRSPSCGVIDVDVHSADGMKIVAYGPGIWTRAFAERFPDLYITDEGRLQDPGARENFMQWLHACAKNKRGKSGRPEEKKARNG